MRTVVLADVTVTVRVQRRAFLAVRLGLATQRLPLRTPRSVRVTVAVTRPGSESRNRKLARLRAVFAPRTLARLVLTLPTNRGAVRSRTGRTVSSRGGIPGPGPGPTTDGASVVNVRSSPTTATWPFSRIASTR